MHLKQRQTVRQNTHNINHPFQMKPRYLARFNVISSSFLRVGKNERGEKRKERSPYPRVKPYKTSAPAISLPRERSSVPLRVYSSATRPSQHLCASSPRFTREKRSNDRLPSLNPIFGRATNRDSLNTVHSSWSDPSAHESEGEGENERDSPLIGRKWRLICSSFKSFQHTDRMDKFKRTRFNSS